MRAAYCVVDVKGEDYTDSMQPTASKSSTRGGFQTPSATLLRTTGKQSAAGNLNDLFSRLNL